jgi:molybdate transport system regulatory protein
MPDYGRRLVSMFRAVESEYRAAMAQLYREPDDVEGIDKAAFRRLLRRITLHSSARNRFVDTARHVMAVVTGKPLPRWN